MPPTIPRHTLSKSTFIRGMQCHKSLYLNKFYPGLRDELSERQQAVFQRGTSVGELAQQLFPGGVNAGPETPFEYQKSVALTKELIDGGQKIIYEAAFQFNGVLAAMDILVNENGQWKAYEVKSSTGISEVYFLDASLQYYVITNLGISLSDISIVHINNQYVRNGKLDLHALFKIESVKKEAEANQKLIRDKVEELKQVLTAGRIPDIKIGPHCLNPYACDFMGHCWKDVPEPSVFDIANMPNEKKFILYSQGIDRFEQLTEQEVSLSAGQRLQVNCYLSKSSHIDRKGIKDFLETISYPLYFLDFETFNPAVPVYNNTRPYQQIPFQYSLHIKRNKNSPAEHFEFLASPDDDPRAAFVKSLMEHIESPGDILTYNQSFEKSQLKELAMVFPQYSSKINNIISRIKDLSKPFQQKLYYTPEMNGLYSIKAVLPALIPELSYDDLTVHNGEGASRAFEQMMNNKESDYSELRKNLLAYCEMDTFAMVKIMEHLEAL